MLSFTDLKILINYISENYIVCQYKNGDSVFTELLLKKDVYVEQERSCGVDS